MELDLEAICEFYTPYQNTSFVRYMVYCMVFTKKSRDHKIPFK